MKKKRFIREAFLLACKDKNAPTTKGLIPRSLLRNGARSALVQGLPRGLIPFISVILGVVAMLCACLGFVGCTDDGGTADKTPNGADGKVLVAYFSCTNTTKGVAESIHSGVSGSTIYQITPAVPYTQADLDYNSDCRANREQNDPAARPAITGSVESIEQYDVIFIGYPIWWGQAPKIIYTFFESYDYDFADVTIIPFCTSGSSGIGTSATNLHGLAPKANWKSGARISRSNNDNEVANLIAQMD